MKLFVPTMLALLAAPAVSGQHQTFLVSPDASEVRMKLNTTHEVVNGTFHIQSGSVDFDPSAHQISGIVIVAAGSGKTGNDSRDKKMSKDILKTNQFSSVSFAPKNYQGEIASTGNSSIRVDGVFTLLGVAHNLTIPMQLEMAGQKTMVKAHFVIPYVEWGLKNPSFLFWKADNDVDVDLNLVGTTSK